MQVSRLTLGSLSKQKFSTLVKTQGVRFKIGPFNVKLKTAIRSVIDNVYALYMHVPLLNENDFIDFHISLTTPKTLRRFIRPQVNFNLDQTRPFKPLAFDQSCAFFEWGLNWVIAQHAMQYLMIHSAVVEKNGRAIIFPGMPGAGKSTLCAAMSHHGWRLLSDEQALISLSDHKIYPLARPICLKNESINIIKHYCPSAEFGQVIYGTAKGDITHVKAPLTALEQIDQAALPGLIVFPQFSPQTENIEITPLTQGKALIELISHCFNYTVLGSAGFTALSSTVKHSTCYSMRYQNLDQALEMLDQLHCENMQ